MTQFYVDIENSSGSRLGSGPLTSVANWQYTARMDQAGEFRFTMAATDPQVGIVAKKRVARAWALVGGVWTDVGAGIVDNIVRRPQRDGTVLLEVSGADLLRELTYRSVRDLRLYLGGNPVSHAAALAATAAYAPAGWSFTPDGSPPITELYGRFNGESVLAAMIKIAEKSRSHFYRGAGRSLVYDHTFAPSGIRAIQAGPGDLAPETCAITALIETIDSYDLLTRIYPRGSGNGDVQLTLKATTRTAPAGYTLNAAQNYIQDDAATATYGQIEEFVEWRELGPVENTAADIRAAANQLFDEASAELARRSQATETPYYDLQLAGCSTLLRPMQSVRVVYRDVTAGVDIDRDLNILEATWQVDAQGVQTTALTVTTSDRRSQGDSRVVADALTQGRVYQALPQLSANEYVTSFSKNVDADNNAVFRFRFSRAVTALRWAYFEFKLLPFESTVKNLIAETVTSSSGGSSVGSSAAQGDHTHTVTIAAHSHTVTIAAHSHTVTVPAHAHTVTVPGHNHTVSISSHTHTVSISGHTHAVPNHQHYFRITLGGTVSYPIGYGASGTSGGLVSTLSGSTHDYPTNSSSGATTASSGGSSTPTTASGGSQTPTSSTSSDTSSSSSTSDQATSSSSQQAQAVVSSSQQAQTTPTSSSGGSHTHTVTVPSHTHTVTPVITTVYGIYRESAGNTYDLTELEYRVNSGAWAALSAATALGDSWYRLDITPAIQDADTLLPTQESNTVEVRGSGVYAAPINFWVATANHLRVNVLTAHGLSIGDRVRVSGAAAGTNTGKIINGDYAVTALYGTAQFGAYVAGSDDESLTTQGTAQKLKTATIDAQLSVHTTIQPIYQ